MIAKNAENARSLFAGLLRKGIAVTVQWDAGGDQRVVLVQYDGREENGYEKAEELLIEDIAQELSLPIWGEEFNTGNGRLVLEDNDTVALVFSAYEFTFPEGDSKFIKTPMDDPFNTFAVTDISYTSFRYTYYYFNDSYQLDMRCWDKKTFAATPLPEEAVAHYKKLLEDTLKEHVGEAGKIADAAAFEIFSEITAFLHFPGTGTMNCNVTFELKKITNAHKEEKIVLFDT